MTLRDLHDILATHLDRWGESEVELCTDVTKDTQPVTGLWFPEPPSDGPVQIESVVWVRSSPAKGPDDE